MKSKRLVKKKNPVKSATSKDHANGPYWRFFNVITEQAVIYRIGIYHFEISGKPGKAKIKVRSCN